MVFYVDPSESSSIVFSSKFVFCLKLSSMCQPFVFSKVVLSLYVINFWILDSTVDRGRCSTDSVVLGSTVFVTLFDSLYIVVQYNILVCRFECSFRRFPFRGVSPGTTVAAMGSPSSLLVLSPHTTGIHVVRRVRFFFYLDYTVSSL